jgi:uncharacterized protein
MCRASISKINHQKSIINQKTNSMKSIIICLASVMTFMTTSANITCNANHENPKSINSAFKGMYATPLVVAITKGEVEIVKKFVAYGADVNEMTNGKTPLMYAARANQLEITKFLVENGATINIKDKNGLTALDYAKISGATEVIEYLNALK